MLGQDEGHQVTSLREEGKVILPVSSGGRTTPLVTSLHLRQRQAQDTTSFRSGHRSPRASTRCTISPISSGGIRSHLPPSSSSSPVTSNAPSLPPPSISSASSSSSTSPRSRRALFLDSLKRPRDDDETLDKNALCSDISPPSFLPSRSPRRARASARRAMG
ncbi:hypothetical protein MUK42_10645 [Musa troglodytarum]|uniref:Uncharacterized protein n=1 Tax=Musa troglodytarum TaxID=320322 RepID=A0A9E7GX80_9LILI|nr:hypothetical protein MUK42_10645 [Musa troglodytarum]